MNWQAYIHSDSGILAGKPVVKGTRLSVEFILERLATGWTEQMILENYPGLSPNLSGPFAPITMSELSLEVNTPKGSAVNRKTVDGVDARPGGAGPSGAQDTGFHAFAINGRRLRRDN